MKGKGKSKFATVCRTDPEQLQGVDEPHADSSELLHQSLRHQVPEQQRVVKLLYVVAEQDWSFQRSEPANELAQRVSHGAGLHWLVAVGQLTPLYA